MLWGPREFYLALAVGLWLCGYFMADGWEQRRVFKWLLPVFFLNGDLLVKSFRETRWLWGAAGLLVYQALSRLWSDGSEPLSNPADLAMVFLLLVALVTIGRREGAGAWILAGLAILSTTVTLFSLFLFYAEEDQVFAVDRLRNVFIYEDGLNPVLTGMLCAFGAVVATWFTRRDDRRPLRIAWLACLAVLIFGLMMAQSRGAMLAAGAGLLVLVYYLRRAVWPAVLTIAVTVGAYIVVLLRLDAEVNLIERGSAGRVAIYQWFLDRTTILDTIIGRGMSADVTIAEEELGWFVDHPHSAYLTQFILTGVLGLGILLFVIGWATRCALVQAKRKEALWLALIASGSMALLFDCGQMFSLYSAPRIEFLLLLVPAALLMGRAAAEE
ncbi:MAG: O-antigen ligase family protein [Roseibacillus sp.]